MARHAALACRQLVTCRGRQASWARRFLYAIVAATKPSFASRMQTLD